MNPNMKKKKSNLLYCILVYSLLVFTVPILIQKEDSSPQSCAWSCSLTACHRPQLQIVNEAIKLMEVHKQGF